eukprot:5286126-Ditylum_brightwellii.AAC.2
MVLIAFQDLIGSILYCMQSYARVWAQSDLVTWTAAARGMIMSHDKGSVACFGEGCLKWQYFAQTRVYLAQGCQGEGFAP